MICEQRKDLMPLLLIDALEPAEAMALRAHLAGGCTRCAGFLAEADAMLSHLPYALPQATPPARALDRIMQLTVVEAAAPRLAQTPRRLSARWNTTLRRFAPMAAAACIILVLGAWGALSLLDRQKQDYRAIIAARDKTIADLKTREQATSAMVEIVNTERARKIMLEGREQPKAWGRMLLDPRRNVWHVFAY